MEMNLYIWHDIRLAGMNNVLVVVAPSVREAIDALVTSWPTQANLRDQLSKQPPAVAELDGRVTMARLGLR